MEEQVELRTNIMGFAVISLGLLLALGGYIMAGLSAPLIILGVYCFISSKRSFYDLLSLQQYRSIYIFLFVAALVVWLIFGIEYSISFMVGSFFFSYGEPIVRHFMGIGQ